MYRILWTRPDIESPGGWYNDIEAPDAAAAAWQLATSVQPGPDGKLPVLVSVTELP